MIQVHLQAPSDESVNNELTLLCAATSRQTPFQVQEIQILGLLSPELEAGLGEAIVRRASWPLRSESHPYVLCSCVNDVIGC
eukprot:g42124.t1